MKLYSIALLSDLIQATSIRFRQRLAVALNQYADLSASEIDRSFYDALARATEIAADTPSMRAWTHTIASLAASHAKQRPVPYSSLVGYLHTDGPTAGRIFELLGWEGLGAAACGAQDGTSFELPSAPPSVFPIGACGAFKVGEYWPTSGTWTLAKTGGATSLKGPEFAATSSASDCAWISNIRITGTGIDVFIPLSNPALINRDFQEFPMVRSRPYAVAWASVVQRAAKVISRYSEFAAACTETLVRCVVPLAGGNDAVGSASLEEVLGLIFLPTSNDLDQITECLLHEAMHQYLFRIEECGELFTANTNTADQFYSPWRSDPRSLRMTLHGAFVFVAVADLYLWENTPALFEMDHRECLRRAYYRAKQVHLALEIVRRNAGLTRFGKTVFDAIEHDAASVFDRTRPTNAECAAIEALLNEHRRCHAAYVR